MYSASNQQSTSASGASNSGFDNSGFVVNYGGGVSTASGGLGVPSWVWIAAAVVAVVWIAKRKR